ncbi:MAG: DUF4856 domain-containing protein [Flavicella sp.]
MKLKLVNLGVLAASMLVFASCEDDDKMIDDVIDIVAPDTYTFEVNGNSTVSYGGQTTRLQMVDEIYAILDAESAPEDVDGLDAKLDSMFFNGTKFSTDELNNSKKKLGNKVGGYQAAVNKENIVAYFRETLEDYAQNVVTELGEEADQGKAGKSGKYQLNAKGMELDQVFAKGLIGALCLDQVANGYLSYEKISAADNTERDEVKFYTTMEHYWDEGYGYVYGLDSEDTPSDILLKKYLVKDDVNSGYEGNAADVLAAFTLGRAAIVAGNTDVRDAQAAIVSQKLSEVVIHKAIYYLNSAAEQVNESGKFFHALSEGYGFIFSLQFTHDVTGNPYFTNAEVNEMLGELSSGNGFWDRTDAELTTMADKIAAKLLK